MHDTRQSCRRVLRCHEGRVKRIVTENSPDLFLTVAEVIDWGAINVDMNAN